MFLSGFDSLIDGLSWYYIAALLISLVAILTSFIFGGIKQDAEVNSTGKFEKSEEQSEKYVVDYEETEKNNLNETKGKRGMKNSAALMAEKVIKDSMTEEQRSLEQEVRRKQLAEIYRLMQSETDKFGDISLNEVEEQMKLYQ